MSSLFGLAALATLAVASARVAPLSCWVDMDVGNTECGYMDTLKIVAEPGYDFPGWFKNANETASAGYFTSPAKCQELCAALAGCDYFAFFTTEHSNDPSDIDVPSCFLKAGFTEEARAKANVTDGSCDPVYTPYPHPVTSGPKACPPCFHMGMDVGNTECGYMDTVLLIGAPGYIFPGWFKGENETAASADDVTPEKCQHACAMHANCSYFAHFAGHNENEGIAACFLKRHYDMDAISLPADGSCDPLYTPYTDSVAVSGPWECPDTTCGDMKGFYKEMKCCGNPAKVVPKPTFNYFH